MNIQPVILSGGAGTRLWPLSRELFPKQLHAPFGGEFTLLQHTVMRLKGIEAQHDDATVLPPILVCNEEHRFLVAEQMRQIQTETNGLILEPVGRNTAPALTLAALHAATVSGDSVMLVMPADHVIRDVDAFQRIVYEGALKAVAGNTVTFGVTPTFPATGYGYIKRSNASESEECTVSSFIEKPDEEKAKQLFKDDSYSWNSGIFMMKPSIWLGQLKYFQKDMHDICQEASEKGVADGDFRRVDVPTFEKCPSDSIDYAVMEHLASDQSLMDVESRLLVIPLDAGWSDVGGWANLQEEAPHDEHGNAILGDVITHNVKNSLLLSSHRLIAGVGLENLIVVETADAVLVANKDDAQHVKEIVAQLKLDGRSEHQIHKRVHRPWGNYEGIDLGERYQVKRITVRPGASLSLQMHHHRAEHWIVVSGTARVTRGDEEFLLSENESTYIPIGVKHRLVNPGHVALEIIEVQSGSYLGEDDIVRFDDEYGR
ncbi:MAG: mannose-1-phosphate guanylyltransferase/mannose-6-phosphate isomerase [Thiotrichaceae bacterium]|nr:mannose-1-phosphate guanylyltransferase/mannose-6-phosphate isomerase [Thiotrichaceae bacterium]